MLDAPKAASASLPKLVTIKNRRDFLAANARARKYVTPMFILLAHRRPKDHPIADTTRIGYTVTKKMGGAVQRNRIKRRLREAARTHASTRMLQGYDYIIIARNAALDCQFSELLANMEIAFSRIHAT